MTLWDAWLEETKPLIPVIVVDNPDDAVPLANALLAGGIGLLEVTLRTSAGLEAIQAIRAEVPEVVVGVGTVTTPEQLHNALSMGAEFAVSPGMTQKLLDCAREWGGPYLPGVATPSDVMTARDAGFFRQKLFPAGVVGGQNMLKALSGPFNDVSFCPTGGVTQDNASTFLTLNNVFAVGGSWLTPKAAIAAQNWQDIKNIAASS